MKSWPIIYLIRSFYHRGADNPQDSCTRNWLVVMEYRSGNRLYSHIRQTLEKVEKILPSLYEMVYDAKVL